MCPGTTLLNSRNSICQQEIQVLFINNHLSIQEKICIIQLVRKNTFIFFRHVCSSEPSYERKGTCVHLFGVRKISFKGRERLIKTGPSPCPRALLTSSPLLPPLKIEPGKVPAAFPGANQILVAVNTQICKTQATEMGFSTS